MGLLGRVKEEWENPTSEEMVEGFALGEIKETHAT